ncbi:MAG: hypothetical protein K2P88_03165 [Chitinophagaceae bacterium]|nr:hypothetical protein [Chitinophagaceae bacterium]
MNRYQRKLLNLFAFGLLAFAVYINFFHKEAGDKLIRSVSSQASSATSMR